MTQRPARHANILVIQRICRQHRGAFGFVQRPVLADAVDRQNPDNPEADHRHLLIVETDRADDVIGFLRLYHHPDGATTLHEIGVERAHVGQGIGSALMQRAIAETRSHGQQALQLFVPIERETNAWYPRFGFVHNGTRAGRVRDLNRYRLELA
ncbi:hypothetical protein CKO28_02920 [Rhodovibrio sodomensis]|uniref:N-acetyltransferase domain-containing protein n=2 Tax=Rhodovibrio sodomensis TaxID=1088 RepID=A0ABS1DC74_9PROT|nr:hypothetical protein [Rhodovibrio sodomensis]